MNEDTTTAGAGPRREPAEAPGDRPPAGERGSAPSRAQLLAGYKGGKPLLVGGYKGMSGNQYVVAELDEAGTGANGEPGPACAAVPVREPGRCGHGDTVCRECAGTWVTGGWTLRFDRTAGGRRLRDTIGGGALAAMAERRAEGTDPAAARAHQAMADLVRAGERDREPYRARPARPVTAGDGAAPRVRDLTKPVTGLSGGGYVIGELDTSYRDAGGTLVTGLERVPLRIRTPPRCGHGQTVCAECAESWMYDWTLYFDRTAGGRRLRDTMGGGALAAMAARRADWGTGAGR